MKATLLKGWGYWDVSRYPYGGEFHRADNDTEVEIIPGAVKYADEKRIKLPNGHEAVIKSAALKTTTECV